MAPRSKKAENQETSVVKEHVNEYGTVTKILFGQRGTSGSCIIHPEELEQLKDVTTDNNEVFTDEQGITWVVSEPEEGTFYFSSRGLHGLNGSVKKSDLFATKTAGLVKRAFIKGYVPQMKDLNKIGKNLYECPSTKDFWKVSEDGKIMRLTATEVDNGERLEAAPANDPESFMKRALAELNLD